jgi:hypothetical protein
MALAVSLAGCSTGNLLGGSSTPQDQQIASAPATLPTAQPVNSTRIALAPVVGAPDAIGKMMSQQLAPALERQRVTLAKAGEKADYTLRGYMVAAKERTGVKVSYIWDLTDPTGKRANRIQGQEIVKGGDGRDPWSAVTPEITQAITDKTSTSIAGAVANLAPKTGNAMAPVGVGAPAAASRAQAVSTPVASAAPAASAATGSIPRGPAIGGLAAVVPSVSGAPGDGNTSLAEAMRQELQQAGVAMAGAGQGGYTVAGKVTMGAKKNGKQPIKIDWRVSDPNGQHLATVTQNNEIGAGALDGPWGNIANDAAQGAAVKIKTLIDNDRASGNASAAKSAARSRS